MRPFSPGPTTIGVSVSASSQAVKLVDQSGTQQVRICNLGTAPVFIRFGGSTITSTLAAGMPIPAAPYVEVITLPPDATHVAVIAAGATGDIEFTLGAGI